ncbi:MAG: HAD family hydrolase [Actinomycetota bacterium]|nr:HAD family hydrolase [Actinomycetota bacterium]
MDGLAADAVVVDLDGTVWDSAPWYGALAEATGRQVPEGLTAARLLKAVGYTERTFARACANARPPLRLYPEVEYALEHLAQMEIALGAVTNLPRWMARPMLTVSGLASLLGTVIDYGATSRRKPQPDPLLEACRRIGCAPGRTWYVGDHPDDATAAARANMPFAWASWGYTPTAPPTAQRLLESPSDIRTLHEVPA